MERMSRISRHESTGTVFASGGDPTVAHFRQLLGVDPALRRSVAVVRVSSKGKLDLLDDQLDTGLAVYRDHPDWQSLRAMSGPPTGWRGFDNVRYCDLDAAAGTGRVGWVGVVGETVFLLVDDSAAARNLPALAGDPAGLDRNAFTVLLVTVCIAVNTAALHVPFRSRWWRNDANAHYLMEALNVRLGTWELWEGGRLIPTAGSAKVATTVSGTTEVSYADTLKEQTFTKSVERLKKGGEWDRRDVELPLGLRRRTGPRGRKDVTVELHTRWLPVVSEALRLLSEDRPWSEIAAYLTDQRVPMRGARGAGRTFRDYSTDAARVAGAKALLTGHRALGWFEHGMWTEERSTALIAPTGELRAQPVEHEDGRSVARVETRMPAHQFLDADAWALVHQRLAREQAERSRRTGAAAHRRGTRVSAFRGVSPWRADGLEHVLVPDSATAYRWRSREPLERGWHNDEGAIEATLRRPLFHHGFARALLGLVEQLTEPLAPPVRVAGADPLDGLRSRVEAAASSLAAAERKLERVRDELLSETDEEEILALRDQRDSARDHARLLRTEHAALVSRLAEGESAEQEPSSEEADVTEVVLVASLLLDGDGLVEPEVADALERWGVTRSLRLDRVEGQRGTVRASATAALPLLNGERVEIQPVWDTPDSHAQPGEQATLRAVLRTWATGNGTVAVAAAAYPGFEGRDVHRILRNLLRRSGINHRGRRAALLDCPLEAPRRIVAAHVLDEPALAAQYPEPYRRQVLDAYLADEPYDVAWCGGAEVDAVRRVLAVYADRPDTWDGLDDAAVAAASGVPRARIRGFAGARAGNLLVAEGRTVRPQRCAHPDCRNVALTVYLPTPETGRGLICAVCRRAEGPAVLPTEYLDAWRRTPDGYLTDPVPTTARPDPDEVLTVTQVAALTGISPPVLRSLDAEGELVPDGHNLRRTRLYKRSRIAAIPTRDLERWRDRSPVRPAPPEDPTDILLPPGEAAARTGRSPKALRRLAADGQLPFQRTDRGERRYRIADLDALPAPLPATAELFAIGDAARLNGLDISTLRSLTNQGHVPAVISPDGERRYLPDELAAALDRLGLRGSPDNPIVAIGELSSRTGVPAWRIRELADAGRVPVAGRVGGKRRFRLRDAAAAVTTATGVGADG